jgi:hypothetical protein
MAKKEATPRRLSSESTGPAPQRGTRLALTSRLRRNERRFPATCQPQADGRRQHTREGLAGR